jgi:hypothetical protein
MKLDNRARFFGPLNSSLRYFFIVCISILSLGCEHFSLNHHDDDDEPKDGVLGNFGFDQEIGSWNYRALCCSWSAGLSDSVFRAGTKSLRFELRQGDIAGGDPLAELGFTPQKNREGWFGLSVYFPESFVKDTMEESIVKWQSAPDLNLGELWRSPPLLLGVLNDSLVLEIRTDHKKVTKQGEYTFERLNLAQITRKEWHDLVFHISWAHDDTGVIEIWKNGELLLSRVNKPNSFNDEQYPYFQVGLYKWGWDITRNTTINTRTVYIDQVRVGNEKASYDKVFPGRP